MYCKKRIGKRSTTKDVRYTEDPKSAKSVKSARIRDSDDKFRILLKKSKAVYNKIALTEFQGMSYEFIYVAESKRQTSFMAGFKGVA